MARVTHSSAAETRWAEGGEARVSESKLLRARKVASGFVASVASVALACRRSCKRRALRSRRANWRLLLVEPRRPKTPEEVQRGPSVTVDTPAVAWGEDDPVVDWQEERRERQVKQQHLRGAIRKCIRRLEEARQKLTGSCGTSARLAKWRSAKIAAAVWSERRTARRCCGVTRSVA